MSCLSLKQTMVAKSKTTVAAPEVVVYTQLKLPSESYKEDALSDELADSILLKVQGEAVEASEDCPIPILMAAFSVIHKVSPEMILRLKNGRRILIFNHWGNPVIRDKDIEVISEKIEHKKTAEFIPELVVDLESIWKKFGVEEDNSDAISKALREAAKSIKPAMITTLVGKAPALLFLLVQHMLYGKTAEIWYQESVTGKPINVTIL